MEQDCGLFPVWSLESDSMAGFGSFGSEYMILCVGVLLNRCDYCITSERDEVKNKYMVGI